MKDLFFYSNIEHDNDAVGITKKVRGQIRAFINLGYDVTYTCYLPNSTVAILDAKTERVLASKRLHLKGEAFHAARRFALMRLATSFIAHKQYDLMYARYHYFDHYSYMLLKEASKSCRCVVMEMHSYPCLGKRGLKNTVFRVFERLYTSGCIDNIDLLANMSNERLPLSTQQVQIRNTFDPQEIEIRHPIEHGDGRVTLLSVAYERPAHGFDRIVKGLSRYYERGGAVNFNILFVGRYLDSTKKLVADLNLQSRCKFIPPAAGEELDTYYDRADIAIGHLANHRLNSFSGSAIKTQEFLAKGIPFIYAWNETMLDADFPYALKVDLSEEDIDFKDVTEFTNRMSKIGYKKIASNMRRFFEREAGWIRQMEAVVDATSTNGSCIGNT